MIGANPFGVIRPRGPNTISGTSVTGGARGRGKPMYASLLHINEDKKDVVDLKMPPIS